MPGDVLMALAQFAGQTVAQAAITDVWEAVRGRFARLMGRGNVRKTKVAEQWLAQTHGQLTAAAGSGLEQAHEARRSGGRAGSRICWMKTLAGNGASRPSRRGRRPAAHPGGIGGGSFGGGRAGCDHHAIAGDAAGVIHGNVASPDPTPPGPATSSRTRGMGTGPRSVAADRGSTAIGALESSGGRRWPASRSGSRRGRCSWRAGKGCSLSWTPGWPGPGRPGPRLMALYGLGRRAGPG